MVTSLSVTDIDEANSGNPFFFGCVLRSSVLGRTQAWVQFEFWRVATGFGRYKGGYRNCDLCGYRDKICLEISSVAVGHVSSARDRDACVDLRA